MPEVLRRLLPVLLGGVVALGVARPAAALAVSWDQLHPGTSPAPRYGYGLTYDSHAGDLVLFGGAANSGGTVTNSSETWAWDGGSWSLRHPAASPPGTREFAMAYDPDLNQTVMFGGVDPSGMTRTTWVYDGSMWTQAQPAHVPPGSYWSSLAYDPADHDLILFGGADPSLAPGVGQTTTWRWTGSDWQQVATQGSPPGRYGASLGYDQSIGKLVLFGGWTQINCSCGKGHALGDTWEYGGGTWSQVSSTLAPSPRYGAALAYDAQMGETVLFGGLADPYTIDDTWTFSQNGWALSEPISPPGCRSWMSAAYDAAAKQTVLFGGWANCDAAPYGYMGDTWKLVPSPLAVIVQKVTALVGSLQDFTVATIQGGRPPYTASVSWGDGTTSAGTVSQSGSAYVVSARHLYSIPGTLEGKVVVTDADGSSAAAALPVDVSGVIAALPGRGAPVPPVGLPGPLEVAPNAAPAALSTASPPPVLDGTRTVASRRAALASAIRSGSEPLGAAVILVGVLGAAQSFRTLRRRRRRSA
ncbi:MAG TPA: kelch repeat-containing protein [Candidatus Dormibacteraeota bacterium]